MPHFVQQLFSTGAFMPHGHCYLWKPGLLWLEVLSNGAIGLAYVAISVTLVYLIYRERKLPFQGMTFAFGAFIVSCGVTHFFDIYVIWNPVYWLDGGVRAVTAGASVVTAAFLPPLVPKAVALSRGADLARRRGVELERMVDDLGKLYQRTRELDEVKTQFFANVSHELRTPLALITGPVERLLAGTNLTAEQRRDLELIARNATSLSRHVDDLLDVARIEAGRLSIRYSRSDLAKIVREVAAHFDGLAGERNLAYQVETPERLIGEVDSDKLRRVLLNLLSNAFKFTPARGHVRCTLTEDRGRAVVTVSDSGPGVPLEQRGVVFERFRQADGSVTRRYGGTGLGLAIARDFVEAHGGQVSLDEAPEGGARFTVALPLRAPEGTELVSESEPAAQASAAQVIDELHVQLGSSGDGDEERADELRTDKRRTDKPRVVVVEDNPAMRLFLNECLAVTYAVETASDGYAGLAAVRRQRPDAVVTDVMMPQMSGDELVRAIREDPEIESTPILVLTARADQGLRVGLLALGALDYVLKPFSVEELRARVDNLVVVKRTRDVLRAELDTRRERLDTLATEVARKNRELSTALDAVRFARDQAEQASRVKTRFLGMVSHELRTPLGALRLQLERLERANDPELGSTQRELVQRALASTKRLTGLIETLLNYSRIQSGRLSIQREPFDLASVVGDAVQEVQPAAEQKDLELCFRPDERLPELISDFRLVRLVSVNLIGNAVKFTEEGTIDVRVSASEGFHWISVTDRGAGIRPEDQARIFEPFEQLEATEHKHQTGVGLGLSLVHELSRALGGRIDLDSKPGQGSTFTLLLPSHPQNVSADWVPMESTQ